MKEEIKELRVKLDGLAQLTEHLQPIVYVLNENELKHYNDLYSESEGILSLEQRYNSKEIEKAYDSLILAKAWLGKILGELGESTPYANDGQRHTVADIEPTADTIKILEAEKAYLSDKGWSNMNHIEQVDWLREEIDKSSKEFTVINLKLPVGIPNPLCVNNFFTHMAEARFWLGFELQRIRENGTT